MNIGSISDAPLSRAGGLKTNGNRKENDLFQKAFAEAEQLCEAKPPKKPPAGGAPVTANGCYNRLRGAAGALLPDENKKFAGELRNWKEQNDLRVISDMYAHLGEAEKAPQEHKDITAKDRALLCLAHEITNSGGYYTYVTEWPDTAYGYGGAPAGFGCMDKNAVSMALMRIRLDRLYSDKGINRLIDKTNVPPDIARETLFKAMQSAGAEQLRLLEENIKQAAANIAGQMAEKTAETLKSGGINGSESDISALKDTFTDMLNGLMISARDIIGEIGLKNIYSDSIGNVTQETLESAAAKLREHAYADSGIMISYGNNRYTRRQFEEMYNSVLQGINK